MGGITLVVGWPCAAGLRSLEGALDVLTTFGVAGSIFCATVALARSESVAAGPLNHWDEALAHLAFARLAHLIHGVHG